MSVAGGDEERPEDPQWWTYCEDCDWGTEVGMESTARGHVHHHEEENPGHSAGWAPLDDSDSDAGGSADGE